MSPIHQDHLGSTSVITDESGDAVNEAAYSPWGNVRVSTGTADIDRLYTGQRFDAVTGLYYYNARYYDPELARFISPDTIVPGVGDPQAWNRYAYVLGNPLRYTDPSGHCIAPAGKTPSGSILYTITGEARDRFDCTFDEYTKFDFEFAQFYGQLVLDHQKRTHDPVAKLLSKLNSTPGRTFDLLLFAASGDYSRGCRATGWGQMSCPAAGPGPLDSLLDTLAGLTVQFGPDEAGVGTECNVFLVSTGHCWMTEDGEPSGQSFNDWWWDQTSETQAVMTCIYQAVFYVAGFLQTTPACDYLVNREFFDG